MKVFATLAMDKHSQEIPEVNPQQKKSTVDRLWDELSTGMVIPASSAAFRSAEAAKLHSVEIFEPKAEKGIRKAKEERHTADREHSETKLSSLARSQDPEIRRMVAANSFTSPRDLEEVLAKDPDDIVRYNVASNANATGRALSTLAHDKSPAVRIKVAEHRNATPDTIKDLAKDVRFEIREVVAHRRDTSPRTLLELAYDANPVVREAAASNASMPAYVLNNELAKSTDARIRAAVAGNPSAAPNQLAYDQSPLVRAAVGKSSKAHPFTLERLSYDTDPSVRAAVAGNINTSGETLIRLCSNSQDISVQIAAASNPNMPTEALTKLIDDPSVKISVKGAIADNRNAPGEALARLAIYLQTENATEIDRAERAENESKHIYQLQTHSLMGALLSVAHHPNTPPVTLRELAMHKDASVRSDVASNVNTPRETLAQLGLDPDIYVKQSVARNSNAPPETLALLAHTEDRDVQGGHALGKPNYDQAIIQLQMSVASNPNTPARIVREFALDPNVNSRVKAYIPDSPNLSTDVIQTILDGKDLTSIIILASNPKIPAPVLHTLASHDHWRVRLGVAFNAQTSNETLSLLLDDPIKAIKEEARRRLRQS